MGQKLVRCLLNSSDIFIFAKARFPVSLDLSYIVSQNLLSFGSPDVTLRCVWIMTDRNFSDSWLRLGTCHATIYAWSGTRSLCYRPCPRRRLPLREDLLPGHHGLRARIARPLRARLVSMTVRRLTDFAISALRTWRNPGLKSPKLPAQLVGPSHANLLGHWEPARLLEINKEVLGAIGRSWVSAVCQNQPL